MSNPGGAGTGTVRGTALQKQSAKTAQIEAIDALIAHDTEAQITHSEAMIPLSEVMALIDAKVAEAVAAVKPVDQSPAVTVPTLFEGAYLKHYRCDGPTNSLTPLQIQERKMVQRQGEWVPGPVMPGHKMRFIRGHFFAQTENQVRQLDWMMKTPRMRAGAVGSHTVMGGRPSIYVDDGLDVVRIGDDRYVTKGSEAHKAHLRTLGQF
jgi:hypothetical protein